MRPHVLDSPFSYYTIFLLARLLPLALSRRLGRLVALVVYVFSKKDRRGVAYNLSLALQTSTDHPLIKDLSRRLFMNYGQYMADFFILPQLPRAKVRQCFAGLSGESIIKRALEKGRGAILLSAHLGNWEFGGLMMRLSNYPLAVVALPHNAAATNALVNRFRSKRGIKVIEMSTSPFAAVTILQHLRENGVVAMIGDRDFFGNGSAVDFFGQTVCFPVGPIALAMASDAPLIPAFVIRRPDGRYFGTLEPPIDIHRHESRKRAIQKSQQQIARVFETYIRRYPDQWYSPDPITAKVQP